MLAGSGGVRAVQHSGELRVRQAIVEALQEFRSTDGYRMENRFRFGIAQPSAVSRQPLTADS
jgi:hypothetical protein